MERTSVVWSAVLGTDSDAFMVRREETLLPEWAAVSSNAAEAAAEVLRLWIAKQDRACSITRWADWYGDDEEGSAVVIVHEPESIRGRFGVRCERVIQASARPLSKGEYEKLDKMIAAEPPL